MFLSNVENHERVNLQKRKKKKEDSPGVPTVLFDSRESVDESSDGVRSRLVLEADNSGRFCSSLPFLQFSFQSSEISRTVSRACSGFI